MKLVTYTTGAEPRVGELVDGGVRDLGMSSMLAYLRGEEQPAPGEAHREYRLLAPLPQPPTIRDAMSFERHVLQATRAAVPLVGRVDSLLERLVGPRRSLAALLNRSFYERPAHYLGNPHSVVGPEAQIRIPAFGGRFDFELEWAVVIGREGVDIPRERAREHIAGYTIFNDFSARDEQFAEMRGRLGPSKGKNFDTGNALGPCIVTPDELTDPYDLTMTARVNGEEWARGSTGDAHWRFEDAIAHISRSETLHPGDVIGSGTVGGGCGLELGRFLKPGDVVELEVEGIGILRNQVVSAAARSPDRTAPSM